MNTTRHSVSNHGRISHTGFVLRSRATAQAGAGCLVDACTTHLRSKVAGRKKLAHQATNSSLHLLHPVRSKAHPKTASSFEGAQRAWGRLPGGPGPYAATKVPANVRAHWRGSPGGDERGPTKREHGGISNGHRPNPLARRAAPVIRDPIFPVGPPGPRHAPEPPHLNGVGHVVCATQRDPQLGSLQERRHHRLVEAPESLPERNPHRARSLPSTPPEIVKGDEGANEAGVAPR